MACIENTYKKIIDVLDSFANKYGFKVIDSKNIYGYENKVSMSSKNDNALQFDINKTYNKGDLVSYNDELYITLNTTTGNDITSSNFEKHNTDTYTVNNLLKYGYFKYTTGVKYTSLPTNGIERPFGDYSNDIDKENIYIKAYYTGEGENVIIIN